MKLQVQRGLSFRRKKTICPYDQTLRTRVVPGYMNLLILSVLIISILIGCDDRFEFLEGVNTPPQLSIRNQNIPSTDPSLLIDGVKVSLKNNNLPYTFQLSASDRETNITAISYRFVAGNGSLSQEGTSLSGSINLVAGEATVMFEPQDVGRVVIEFFVEDDFQKRAMVKADLTVFLNLPPVAKFKFEFAGTHGPYEFKLDASESFDQDQGQGGEIKIYHFIINDTYEITTTQPVVTHSFEGPGPEHRDVKLEVIDNDGERSEQFALVVK